MKLVYLYAQLTFLTLILRKPKFKATFKTAKLLLCWGPVYYTISIKIL